MSEPNENAEFMGCVLIAALVFVPNLETEGALRLEPKLNDAVETVAPLEDIVVGSLVEDCFGVLNVKGVLVKPLRFVDVVTAPNVRALVVVVAMTLVEVVFIGVAEDVKEPNIIGVADVVVIGEHVGGTVKLIALFDLPVLLKGITPTIGFGLLIVFDDAVAFVPKLKALVAVNELCEFKVLVLVVAIVKAVPTAGNCNELSFVEVCIFADNLFVLLSDDDEAVEVNCVGCPKLSVLLLLNGIGAIDAVGVTESLLMLLDVVALITNAELVGVALKEKPPNTGTLGLEFDSVLFLESILDVLLTLADNGFGWDNFRPTKGDEVLLAEADEGDSDEVVFVVVDKFNELDVLVIAALLEDVTVVIAHVVFNADITALVLLFILFSSVLFGFAFDESNSSASEF